MAGLHVPLSTLRHSPRGPSTHDSGPSWIATPSMSGALIPFLMPAYPGAFPTFTSDRWAREASSYAPAASPHLRRRLSVWPPRRPVSASSESRCAVLTRACAAARPISARLEPVLALRGFDHWFSSAYTFPSRLPDPGHLAVLPCPVVVGLLPPSPAPPGSGCPQLQRPAATGHRRSPFTSARIRGASWRTNGRQ